MQDSRGFNSQSILIYKYFLISLRTFTLRYLSQAGKPRLFASARLVSSPWYIGPTVMTYWPPNLVHLASRRGTFQAFNNSVIDCNFCSKYWYFEHTGKCFLTESKQFYETKGHAFTIINYLIWYTTWFYRELFIAGHSDTVSELQVDEIFKRIIALKENTLQFLRKRIMLPYYGVDF